MYKWFNEKYSHLSLDKLKSILNKNISDIYKMIDEMSEDELFKPHQRKWADNSTKTAVWEVCKFILKNTAAPFETFRIKIRKWKKLVLQRN